MISCHTFFQLIYCHECNLDREQKQSLKAASHDEIIVCRHLLKPVGLLLAPILDPTLRFLSLAEFDSAVADFDT